MRLEPGTVLNDKLRLERKLGEGATGVVWAAENVGLGSRVAVKVLTRSLLRQPSAAKRFIQEARLIAQIESDHVVKVYDIGVAPDGSPFMVMELLNGEDLSQRMKRLGPLPIADVVAYTEQICHALSVAHARGIVHRDIKPANLMLVATRSGNEIKMLDFGIAKNPAMEELGLTQTSHFLGTPHYMSPEQMENPKAVDHRTDLWSLAVVIYQLMTGKLPFPGNSLVDVSIAIDRAMFEPPSKIRHDAPSQLDGFFARAFQRDLNQRFQNAPELHARLRAAVPLRISHLPVAGDPDFAIKPTDISMESSTVAMPEMPDALGSTVLMDPDKHALQPTAAMMQLPASRPLASTPLVQPQLMATVKDPTISPLSDPPPPIHNIHNPLTPPPNPHQMPTLITKRRSSSVAWVIAGTVVVTVGLTLVLLWVFLR